MAEVAHINRKSKERSEIQSQKIKFFFQKMPDPKQIFAGQDSSVGIAPEEPVSPVPAVRIPVAPDAAENPRSTTASHNLLFSTPVNDINLDVSIHATKKRILTKNFLSRT